MAGWLVGWVVYMIAVVLTVYDGLFSMILQPIIGAVVSAVCVGVCFILGLIFKVPAVGRVWRATRWLAIGLGGSSIFIMFFGSALGLTETFTDPETGTEIVGLRSEVALGSYWVLLFSIVNFPLKQRDIPH